MAKFDRFLIAPLNTGLVTDLKSFLIPDDAYARLQNAYVFRGRTRKRFGSRFMGSGWSSAVTEPLFSRLRVDVGSTAAVSGNFPATIIPVLTPGALWKIGQQFSVGTTVFTVVVANGALLTTGAATGTFNTANGTLTITGNTTNPSTAIWWYPSEPVMGLTNYGQSTINNKPSYAFDTRFAYVFAGGFWQRSGMDVTPIWHGDNLDFFWTENWQGPFDDDPIMFVTNFQVNTPNGPITATDDPLWYFDGTVWTAVTGVTGFYVNPGGGAPKTGPSVSTARLIVAFKDRLVLLNTIENNGSGVNVNYPNRARFSHNGSPFSQNAWYEPNAFDNSAIPNLDTGDGADWIDATTEESIVSAEFIKDRLIVYFERSTWELAYTGNEILPFVWQKINTELGSEATFSTVPFDREVITIGNVGIHSCSGANVQRIDTKIPDEVFKISNKNQGVKRVAGIRDYYVEMVYWTFPSDNVNSLHVYPNRVLVYNYKNGSWGFNDDCITAFGYFEQQLGVTWASQSTSWAEANFSWNSGTVAAQFRQVIAGNQQGYVFIIDAEESRNERALQITNLTYPAVSTVELTILDHTLDVGEFISIENAQGINGPITGLYKIITVIDKDTVQVNAPDVSGVYLGGGNSARISNIMILSKQWNPYLDKDRNVYLAKIDFGVTKTENGEITVDYFPSATNLSMIGQGGVSGTGALMGTNILETRPYSATFAPLEQMQERLWHPVYFQTEGTCIQIYIHFNDRQMSDSAIAWDFFEIQGLVLYVMPTSSRLA